MALLVNRQYTKLWTSGGVSQLGDAIFNTTLVLWVATVLAKDQPWAPLAVSGVLLAMALPALLVAPLAGVFVDRWDFRRTMLVNDAVRTVLVGCRWWARTRCQSERNCPSCTVWCCSRA